MATVRISDDTELRITVRRRSVFYGIVRNGWWEANGVARSEKSAIARARKYLKQFPKPSHTQPPIK